MSKYMFIYRNIIASYPARPSVFIHLYVWVCVCGEDAERTSHETLRSTSSGAQTPCHLPLVGIYVTHKTQALSAPFGLVLEDGYARKKENEDTPLCQQANGEAKDTHTYRRCLTDSQT